MAFALLQAYDPPPEHPLEVSCQEPAEPLAAGRPFTLVSWNIQFCGSRQLHFFYDGGEAVDVPPDLARSTLEGVVRVLAQAAPDLLAIQEIDRDSARTGHVDQGAAIREGIGLACWVTAPYHRSVFVPHPLPNALGAVDMHLGLYARAPLSGAIRTQLPLLREPWYRRAFNLKRAILTADVPVAGAEQPLALATVHLSAFSYGDGTLARQVDAIEAWIRARAPGQPWILAGDLNLLPPGDDPARLGADAACYSDPGSPIGRLLPAHREVLGEQLAEEHRTYLPFGAARPDRKIDYVFVGGPIDVIEARVMTEHAELSDHLPIFVRLRVRRARQSGPRHRPRSARDAGRIHRCDVTPCVTPEAVRNITGLALTAASGGPRDGAAGGSRVGGLRTWRHRPHRRPGGIRSCALLPRGPRC